MLHTFVFPPQDKQHNMEPTPIGKKKKKKTVLKQQQSLTPAYMQPILKSDCPPIYLHTPDSISPHQGWSC